MAPPPRAPGAEVVSAARVLAGLLEGHLPRFVQTGWRESRSYYDGPHGKRWMITRDPILVLHTPIDHVRFPLADAIDRGADGLARCIELERRCRMAPPFLPSVFDDDDQRVRCANSVYSFGWRQCAGWNGHDGECR